MTLAETMALRAALYDWHNSICLRRQSADIDYFREWLRMYAASRVLIVGCGTGRVAGPLVSSEMLVFGLDIDFGRLVRAKTRHPQLSLVCSDVRQVGVAEKFDAVIVPYSTAQLIPDGVPLQQFIDNLAACSAGPVVIDISDSFARTDNENWHVVAQGHCAELGGDVEEWRRVSVTGHYCTVSSRYVMGRDRAEVLIEEVWHFHPHASVMRAARRAGLVLGRLDLGYHGIATHRRIYHFQHSYD